MDFEFSEEQQQIGDAIARLMGEAASSARARASLEREPHGFDRDLWQGMASLGVTAIAIPEAFGGLGLTDMELCVVAEVAGRAFPRAPLASTIYWAAEAIFRLGSEAQKAIWLPRIAQGSAVASFVDTELAGFAQPEASGGGLTGILPVADDAAAADVLVVAGPSGAWLVELDQPGVVRINLQTIDLLQPGARVELKGAAAEPLAGAPLAATLDHLRRRAAILTAFEQVGGCSVAIEESVAYATQRRAFGRAVGSFQAVKHLLANMYVAAELARSNAYYARP